MKDNGEERNGEGDSGERICSDEKKDLVLRKSGREGGGRGEIEKRTRMKPHETINNQTKSARLLKKADSSNILLYRILCPETR